MLVVTHTIGETILIRDDIRLTIEELKGTSAVKFSIEALEYVIINREEVSVR
jgi:carbon storage regulator CsrA